MRFLCFILCAGATLPVFFEPCIAFVEGFVTYPPPRSLGVSISRKNHRCRMRPGAATSVHRSGIAETALFCQLLGFNAARPTDFSCSFRGFARRGGDTDIHSHGWGLAFYDNEGPGKGGLLRAFRDPNPAAESPVAALVSQHPVKTLNMISHIRYATQGGVCLDNVHPFQREMWGIQWCFAHNGDVPLFKGGETHSCGNDHMYQPVGDTDSEAIFCAILNALSLEFATIPTLPVLYHAISRICSEIVDHEQEGTILNFLLGCGEHVQFVYSWPGSRPGSTVWNGLHYTVRDAEHGKNRLEDGDCTVEFAEARSDNERVAVIATKPLTDDEEWVEMERGELLLFDRGVPHRAAEDCIWAELYGHGLLADGTQSRVAVEEDLRQYRKRKSFFSGLDI